MTPDFDPYHKWLGIPPAEQPPHHYRLLGVALFEQDPDVIDFAADGRMAHLRTFQNGERAAECQRLLSEVAAARIALLNPDTRRNYDQSLRGQLERARSPSAAPAPAVVPTSVRRPDEPLDPTTAALLSAPNSIRGLDDLVEPPASANLSVRDPVRSSQLVGKARPSLRHSRRWQLVVVGGVLLLAVACLLLALFSWGGRDSDEEKPLAKPPRNAELFSRPPADAEPAQTPAKAVESNASSKPIAEASSTTAGTGQPKVRPLTLPPKPINLLQRIDPERDAVKGKWQMEKGVLLTPKDPLVSLQIPYEVPAEYELTAVVERPAGNNTFCLGLVGGGRQFDIMLDGYRAKISGMGLVDGGVLPNNETRYDGRVFTNGKPSTIVATVRRDGVRLTADGRSIVDWRGDWKRCGLSSVWTVPDKRALILGSDRRSFKIHSLKIRPLNAEARAPFGNHRLD